LIRNPAITDIIRYYRSFRNAIPKPRVRYLSIPHPFATIWSQGYPIDHIVRLACLSHAASVHSEPGSNSSICILDFHLCRWLSTRKNQLKKLAHAARTKIGVSKLASQRFAYTICKARRSCVTLRMPAFPLLYRWHQLFTCQRAWFIISSSDNSAQKRPLPRIGNNKRASDYM
jgi:hypothetical protein